MKTAVLRAYEWVPETYRQQFRVYVKSANQTFVEFAHEKQALFQKWCVANKVSDFAQLLLLLLLLLDDFKSCLQDNVVCHLNKQKVSSLFEAAVLADEFNLTHKTVSPFESQQEVWWLLLLLLENPLKVLRI